MKNKDQQSGDLKKFDLRRVQQGYFDAMLANGGQANQVIANMQQALLTIILAELAFVGVVDLATDKPTWLGSAAAGLLVLSAFSFILGSHAQFRHLLRITREYSRVSFATIKHIKTTGQAMVDEIPDDLQPKEKPLRTSVWANRFFISAIGLMVVATGFVVAILIRNLGL